MTCSIEGCANPVFVRGWCNRHYHTWWRKGDPNLAPPVLTEVERFWSHVDKTDYCWVWTKTLRNGYGRFRAGRVHSAHIYSWELTNPKVPDGLELDHLCRNRACVRPSHLEPVTRKVNVQRGFYKTGYPRATHCFRGHKFTKKNTYLSWDGRRTCRTCARASRAVKRDETNARRREQYRQRKTGIIIDTHIGKDWNEVSA